MFIAVFFCQQKGKQHVLRRKHLLHYSPTGAVVPGITVAVIQSIVCLYIHKQCIFFHSICGLQMMNPNDFGDTCVTH